LSPLSILFLFRYLVKLGPEYQGSLQPKCHPRNPHLPSSNPGGITYNRALTDMRELLTSLGFDGKTFNLHSMKRGVANHCDEIGIPEEEIMHEGGWKNLKTVKLYINKKDKKSIQNALKIARGK